MGAPPRTAAGSLRDLALPDRYKLVRRIASGGMGSVWCARDGVLGRNVAIKLLGEQFLDDPRAVRRFEREARAAAQLSGHPNVVTIYDVGETDARERSSGRPFIVMEHLTGGSVADAIRVGAVDRASALQWIREAAAAIDYGHEHGIVHRDIKPANLMLDGNRTLHVADFGIARIATEDTITGSGQLFGSAAYVSPEQALGRPATAASDRYSLAVAAYELLVGERPFIAEHFAAQARQHIEDQAPRPSSRNPDLPPQINAVLSRGMAKRPEDRWPTAGELATALEASFEEASSSEAPSEDAAPTVIAAAAPPRAERPAPAPAHGRPEFVSTPPARPRPGRRPRAVVLAALLAAVVAVGIAITASGGSSPKTHLRAAAAARRQAPPKTTARRPAATPAKSHRSASTVTVTTGSSAGAGSSADPAGASTPTTSTSADALQAQGHQLMLSGDYPAAITDLRRAVAAASPSGLTYAYALYDLGRSLRLSGQPQAAIAVLEQRLQIPNQTDVVRQELDLALAAAGQSRGASIRGNGNGNGSGAGRGD